MLYKEYAYFVVIKNAKMNRHLYNKDIVKDICNSYLDSVITMKYKDGVFINLIRLCQR